MNAPTEFARAVCPHDCPDTCAMRVTVEDGQARQGRRRSRPSADARRALHERSAAMPNASHHTRSADYTDETRRPQRRGPLRADQLGRGIRARGRAVCRKIAGSRAGSDLAVQLRRHDGSGSRRQHRRSGSFNKLGASQLDRTICAAAGAAGLEVHLRREPRHAHRVFRGKRTHPDLGLKSDRVEPAFLDARPGSQASRRAV